MKNESYDQTPEPSSSETRHARATAYVFGELSGDDATTFETELAESTQLQETVASIRETVSALQSEFNQQSPTLSAAGRQKIDEALAGPKVQTVDEPVDLGRRPRRIGWIVSLVVAASALMALALTWPTVSKRISGTFIAASFSSDENPVDEMSYEFADEEYASEDGGGGAPPSSSWRLSSRKPSSEIVSERQSGRTNTPFAPRAGSKSDISGSLENEDFESALTRRINPSGSREIVLRQAAKSSPDEPDLAMRSSTDGYASKYLESRGSSPASGDRGGQATGSSGAIGGYGGAGGGSGRRTSERDAKPFNEMLDLIDSELESMPAQKRKSRASKEGKAMDAMGGMDEMGMGVGMDMPMMGEMGMGGMDEMGVDMKMMGEMRMGGMGMPGEAPTVAEGRLGNDDLLATLPKRLAESDQTLNRHKSLERTSGRDRFAVINDNPFRSVTDSPLSTFSIDVDTAAYSKVRMYLMQHRQLPSPDAVRIEEMVNYFRYDYPAPRGSDSTLGKPASNSAKGLAEQREKAPNSAKGLAEQREKGLAEQPHPFAAAMEVAACPWNPKHRLARIGIKGKEIEEQRPASNLVFLLDVSGSMSQPNKLPLVKQGMKMLVSRLGENDSVAIVVYAGAAGLVLDGTTGDKTKTILDSLDRLQGGGSTAGARGIQLAYEVARDNFIPGGTNRVILCTDGDFNVGVTGTDALVKLAAENAKGNVFLTMLGFGSGNHNDEMMEEVSNKANGNYAFIDTEAEAAKVLVEQMHGTLVTIAKDVKIQVEFNPLEVESYRLIGYENRVMAAKDFADDTKDAGEIGAGHTVTALYELVPADRSQQADGGQQADRQAKKSEPVGLRYQKKLAPSERAESGELLTLKLRYKQPTGTTSTLIEFPVTDSGKRFDEADTDFQFASSVAAFGMLLRGSPHKGDANFDSVEELAIAGAKDDTSGYRAEFVEMVRRAKELSQ